MKTALAILVGLCVAFGAGYLVRGLRSPEQRVIAHSRDSLDAISHGTDSSIAVNHDRDSAAVAEPHESARAHQIHAGLLGDSVTHLQQITDAALAAASVSDTLASRAMAALSDEREATQRQTSEFRLALQRGAEAFQILSEQSARKDREIATVQQERDGYRKLLDAALSIRPSRCRPGVMAGGGYGVRGFDAGVFVGMSCTL